VTSADDLVEQELMLNRFNRLIGELMRGGLSRNTFQPWEVEILLDLETCEIPAKRRFEVLRQYQKTVTKQLETTKGPPMTLSRYLQILESVRPQPEGPKLIGQHDAAS